MSPAHPHAQEGELVDQWLRADSLFTELLELPVAQRAERLAQRCVDDKPLEAIVQRLLRAEERSSATLDTASDAVQALAAVALHQTGDDDPEPDSVVQIGPYQLVSCIGKGGSAVVWRGERNDGEFQQTVAVKLLRRWIDSDDSVRRFREERRILAALEHPNLARLLDGGVTPDGWPYFIMEYVDGIPITEYCDRERLDIEQRLDLVLQVIKVVQYAHQRLLVHRDLKPSNILVTESGQVKLLDFGIAKVLQADTEDSTEHELTQPHGRLLTPAYASPEQLGGGRISTATDVYALGVLLYRLLSGRSPYRAQEDAPASLYEAILRQVPAALSIRVLEEDQAGLCAREVAAARDSTPFRLARMLRGDLEAICQVALRKDPEHRYASVEQLGIDIERYRQQLPVLARAGNRRYRLGRFLRRNAWGVSAAVVLPLAIVTALALHVDRLSAERDRAAAAAKLAKQEADKAEQISTYLVGLFRASDPAESRGRDITAVELLERGIAQAQAIQDDPPLQVAMLHVLGQVSFALGRYQQANELQLEALSLLQRISDRSETLWADVLADLGEANFNLGNLSVAEEYYRSALATLPETGLVRRGRILTNLGIVHIVTSRYAEARALLHEALALLEENAVETAAHATTLNALGTLLSREAQHSEAIDMLREAVTIRVDLLGDFHPATSVVRSNLGIALLEAGEPAAAELELQRALEVDQKVLGPTHPSLGVLLNQMASVRRALGDQEGAITYLARSLEILRQHHDEYTPAMAAALSGLGHTHLSMLSFDEAADYLSQAVAIDEQVLGPQSRELAIDLALLARARSGQSRYEEAEALLLRALDIARGLFGDEHALVGEMLVQHAGLKWQRGDVASAIEDGARGLAILVNTEGAERPYVSEAAAWIESLSSGNSEHPPPLSDLLL
ncbi:serine/threonine-protein kinase [Haliea sp.]|jgi:serine/threonine protein kinase/Tfp pilus assembly protein PilF|uniref:serine/threonine-protein kinase n=1 Tax=Haliea TaxID=475794 RepID=UPI00257E4364|nr:serine/threonine-protein kinase [Haliea sp.]|tara:strand:- start:1941 stop:4679 length:2739 start_codon:yes stop_codon:yes gene_type:complete